MSAIFTPSDKLIEEFHRNSPSASTDVPVTAVAMPEEKPKPLSKSALRTANRKLKRALKLLGEVCELTGGNELTVAYSIQRAESRPPAPPIPMTPAKFRELDRTNTYDSLLIAMAFPSYQWDIPALDLVYATAGSGSNEIFISPPRSIPRTKKP